MRLKAELRAGWRAWLSLALLLGVVAGTSTGAAAGARRTATAYPRSLVAQDAVDAITGGAPEKDFESNLAKIKALPAVERWIDVRVAGAYVQVPARRGRAERIFKFPDIFLNGDASGEYLYTVNRTKVVRGRLADRAKIDETMIPFTFADRNDIRVGDSIIAGIGFDSESGAPVETVRLRVTGITAAQGDFEALGQITYLSAYVTPALLRAYANVLPPPSPDLSSAAILLKGGPSAAPAFKQYVERTYGIDVPFIQPTLTSAVQKTMRLYAAALWLLAALIAFAGLAIFGQGLARQLALDAVEFPALRALGFGSRELVFLGFARAAAIGLVAGVTGLLIAVLVSPLTPIGAARVAEPDPGVSFDWAVLGIGTAVALLAALLFAVWPAVRTARVAASPSSVDLGGRSSRLVASARRASASPAAVTGLRMALEPGRGRTTVPIRSTITTVAIAIAAVTATVVAGNSLKHLIATPALTGFTYDAIVPNESGEPDAARNKRLSAYSFVDATTRGTGVNIRIGGVDSFVVGYETGGAIGFAVISGRVPTDAKHDGLPEVALGPATIRRLRLHVGNTVPIRYSDRETNADRIVNAYVVGAAAIPPLPWAATQPGEGAVMTINAIGTFDAGRGGCCFVRFKPGTDLDVARAQLEKDGMQTYLRIKRADLATLDRITGLPVALSAIFGVMALSALAHVLLTAIRRRRRDLAILKTIGFTKGDLRRAIAWQASTVTTLCLVVGIPAGIVLGRWGWRSVADQFGVVPVSVTPAFLALLVPLGLAIANLIAVFPALSAARTQPAVVLHAD